MKKLPLSERASVRGTVLYLLTLELHSVSIATCEEAANPGNEEVETQQS